MPTIRVMAELQTVGAAAPPIARCDWTVILTFNGGNCKHSRNRRIDHPVINARTSGNIFTIPFTQVRGGDLTVEVTIGFGDWMGTSVVTERSRGLKIVGTNPTTAALSREAIMKDCFKRLMRHESGLRQFNPAACPYFSQDNKGGVGLCQVTVPAPTDDQVWSWKENLKRGLEIWRDKETEARGYPGRMRKRKLFTDLVADYNQERVKASLAPLTIRLPDFTPDQVERATIRLFNGAPEVYEYQVRMNGNKLFVNVDATGTTGTAEWEQVTAAMRTAIYDNVGKDKDKRGDPDYVENVYRKPSF